MKNKLTTRQWRLYDLLKSEFEENPNAYLSCNDIMNKLPDYYYFTYAEIMSKTPAHDTAAHQNIRTDINALRNSDEIYKIICSTSKGYKIATEKEANQWLARVRQEAISKFKMYWKNLKDAELNNQLRLVFNKEKDTIEVFQ
jgi:hypothetical protein